MVAPVHTHYVPVVNNPTQNYNMAREQENDIYIYSIDSGKCYLMIFSGPQASPHSRLRS